MILEDDELKEIYRVSSQEHLQTLESGILQLEKDPSHLEIIEDLLRSAHSLKGDSRVVGLETMEVVTHSLEEVFGKIQRQEIVLTAELSDRLYQTIDGMHSLVYSALTGEPCEVDGDSLVASLLTEVNSETEFLLPRSESRTDDLPTESPTDELGLEFNQIADEELKEIYRLSSQEHLHNLESGILQLEKDPSQSEIIEDLLRAAHSLKGDSRVVGVEKMEIVTHTLEEVLSKIQRQEIVVTEGLGDRLYQTLDNMQSLVNEALTGESAGVDVEAMVQLLITETPLSPESHQQLDESESTTEFTNIESQNPTLPVEEFFLTHQPRTGEMIKQSTALSTTEEKDPHSLVKSADEIAIYPTKIEQPYRIDTVRVPTQALDNLITQVGELLVSKTRMAYTVAEIEQVSKLWYECKASRLQTQVSGDSSVDKETIEANLEAKIQRLRTLAQENNTKLEFVAGELEEKIANLRLLPLSQIFQLLPRLVRDLAKEQSKQVELIIQGSNTQVDKKILEEIKDPLIHLIRNAIDHGIETPTERLNAGKPKQATVKLKGYQAGNKIVIELQDDGRGLNLDKIKNTAVKRGLHHPDELENMSVSQIQNLIFRPGFSTRNLITEVSGRGVGMDVVKTNIEKLKGIIEINSIPGQGCTFYLKLPTTLIKSHVLLVEIHGVVHALPIDFVTANLLIDPQEIFPLEGRDTIAINGKAISVANLADLLEITKSPAYALAAKVEEISSDRKPCILLQVGEEKFGLIVDRMLDVIDVALKPQSNILRRVRNVSGATILGTGEVCMILSPKDLLASLKQTQTSLLKPSNHPRMLPQSQLQESTSENSLSASQYAKYKVLLAEDSMLVRTQEKRLLEAAGYEVVTAVDGLDGYNKLQNNYFDAVISDVEMPNLDGFAFTEQIRQHDEYGELPIILVTSLASDEDKRKGAEAGANAYIVKGQFNQNVLLDTLARLV
jgi:two-component system, chemotaxis family, sensor kinase CheA